MPSRRNFLQTSVVSAAAFALSSDLKASIVQSGYLDTIGLQLWTVRNQMENDAAATLQAIADAGYRQVELMNVLGSAEITAMARDKGMKVTSAFADWQSIGNPDAEGAPKFEAILEQAAELKLKHLVFGYIGKGHRETADHYKKHAERANRAGELCRKAGIQLCYHNHSFEFAKVDGDQTGFDLLMSEFDSKLVPFELDVFWVKIGGWDPFQTMKKLSGRMSQVHLKDLKKETGIVYDEGQVPNDAFQELGNGTIDMQRVVKLARECDVQQCHVEQDQSSDPLKSIATSLQHLKKLG